MKSKCSLILKSSIALILTFLMLFGSISTVLAATVDMAETGIGNTLYVCVSDSTMATAGATKVLTNVQRNEKDTNDWRTVEMTSTNKFYNGKRIYSASNIENQDWGGCGKLQILLRNDSNEGKGDKWINNDNNWYSSSNYANKLWNYDSGSFVGTYSDSSYATGFTLGDYYIYNNITDSWYGGNAAPKMTKSGNTYYYDFYLKKNEKTSTDGLLFRFWDSSDSLQIGPDWKSDHRSVLSTNDSWSSTVQSIQNYGDKDTAWQVATSGFTADKYYKVRVTLDPKTLSNSRNGRVKFTSTQLSNMDPTFSTTSFEQGTSYNLTSLVGVTAGSNVGTVSYSTYQYYNGSSWTTISSPSSWTPNSTSITKLRVTATDGGVVASGDTDKMNAMTARAETKETAITVTNTTPTINTFTIDGDASKTLAVNGTATLASTKSNSSASVTYSVTAQSITDGSSGNVVSISGNTVTALQPGTATITASLTGATPKTVSVTVNKPTISPTTALSLFEYNTSGISGAVTATPAGTSTVYTSADTSKFTVDTSGKITPVAAGTANLKIAVTYNSTYTANFTRSVTVKPRETLYVYGALKSAAQWTADSTTKMTWDNTDQCYYWTSPAQDANTSYMVGIMVDNTYHRLHNQHITTSGGSLILSDTGAGINAYLDTKAAGAYKFKAVLNDSGNPVMTVYYPSTVTFNMNGHGSAISSQVVTYGEKATQPTAPTATGYSFGGWFKEAACTNVFNFTTETITADTTVYAKWTGETYTYTTDAKYSTTGGAESTYTNPLDSAVTPASGSATYETGVSITAAEKPGYTFYKWTTTSGSVSFPNAATTTFKPTANGAKATALYKKNYTVTYTAKAGTGKGTLPSASTVVAGNTVTINPTTVQHSGFKVYDSSDTLLETNTSYTSAAITADTTFKIEFYSLIETKRIVDSAVTENNQMTSNADGTEFTYTAANIAADSYYEFKLYANGIWSKQTTSSSSFEGNDIASITFQDGDLGNIVVTPTGGVAIDIDFTAVYSDNAWRYSHIVVRPHSDTRYDVTFKRVADTTITGTYMGTSFSTAEADAVVSAYDGTKVEFTVTAGSGKYVSGLTTTSGSFTPAFTQGATYTGKVSVSAATTVTPAVTAIPTVTTSVNKTDRGSVSVSGTPIPGETITITANEKAGVLSTVTATVNKGNASSETVTLYPKSTASTGAAAPASTGFIASALNKIDLAATGATETITYTVPANTTSLAINAVFDAYSAESDWYYNGYDTSGNIKSSYDMKRMTEGMVDGQKFSYYNVTGRGSEGYNQLFTVVDSSTAADGYVYFTNTNNWGSLHVYFYDGVDWNWPGDVMTRAGNDGNGHDVYKYKIPSGAKGVIFNNGENSDQTVNIDLTTTNGCYYLNGNHNGNIYEVTQWPTPNSDAGIQSGTEYYKNSSGINFSDHWYTGGFGDYNADSHQFARPSGTANSKDLNDCKDDYYIVVLYPNTSYTFNNNNESTGADPVVLWMDELPGGESDSVTVYAKDGAIRAETFGVTYANIADTKIYSDSGFSTEVGTDHSGSISGQTYQTYKAEKGDTLYIRTIINNTAGTGNDTTANNAKYYVRGFCVNGVVSSINTGTSAGTSVSGGTAYDLTYTVPDDYDGSKIEITPIFYLADTANNPIVTFRVQDFPKDKYGWGDTLYCYPFYGTMGSNNNAFGAYPGQPVVYYNGQYSIQIPQKSTAWDPYLSDGLTKEGVANTSVSGITMSNGYFDLVHRSVMGYGSNSASSDHVQTYDYGDFYKIFNEKSPVDNIVYDFKYRTAKHNFETSIASSTTAGTLDSTFGTGGNGFELLKNFHGKNVDLFGTPLSGDAADPTKTTPVYVVSIGGVNGTAGVENIAGWYATEWKVFTSSATSPSSSASYTLQSAGGKSSIPPEVLILNDDNSFNTTTYPSADASHQITDWKDLYDTLKANYTGKPVYISYEAADAQIGERNYATSGGGGATRNDGRWLYSKEGENITSNIKIQYSTDNGVSYTDLNTTTPQVSGLSAYFTNAEVSEGATTYSTTIDSDKTFDFTAKTSNADYKFVGWYMDNENKTLITTDNTGSTERSGSYTFIARFKEVTTGQLILSHNVATDASHTGSGAATIAVTVTDPDNNDTVVKTVSATTSDITLDDKIISTDKGNYDIAVTLNATPAGEDTFALVNTTADAKFMGNATSYPTVPQTFTFKVSDLFSSNTQNVKSLIYNSYFNQTQFKYKFTFTFTDRNNASKNYVREGTLTAAQLANESYYVKDGSTRILKAAFINRLAPEESNFNQSLGWTITDVNFPASMNNNAYTITKTFEAEEVTEYVKDDQGTDTETPVRSTTRTATFDLPYAHNTTTGVATETNGKVLEATATVFTVSNINFGSIPVVNSAYVTAPTKLYTSASDETGKFFQYWSIKKTSSDENEVGRCYFNEFNLVMFDNYYITPVYDTEAIDLNNTGAFTSVTYLETSRNQWNTDGTESLKTDRAKAADLLYNDLVINFNYNNLDIYLNGDDVAAVTDLGYIVERVQQLDSKQDGTLNTDLSLYNTTGLDEDGAKAVVTGYTTQGTTQNGITKYTGSDSRIARYSVAKTALDNKNRLEIYDAYYNSAGWSRDKQSPAAKYTYKNYVYKVYTYMVVSGTTYVSKNPAYFTMYDEATK